MCTCWKNKLVEGHSVLYNFSNNKLFFEYWMWQMKGIQYMHKNYEHLWQLYNCISIRGLIVIAVNKILSWNNLYISIHHFLQQNYACIRPSYSVSHKCKSILDSIKMDWDTIFVMTGRVHTCRFTGILVSRHINIF